MSSMSNQPSVHNTASSHGRCRNLNNKSRVTILHENKITHFIQFVKQAYSIGVLHSSVIWQEPTGMSTNPSTYKQIRHFPAGFSAKLGYKSNSYNIVQSAYSSCLINVYDVKQVIHLQSFWQKQWILTVLRRVFNKAKYNSWPNHRKLKYNGEIDSPVAPVCTHTRAPVTLQQSPLR